MLGWGYPPNIEGGLDIHVAHLADYIRKQDEFDLTLVLPDINDEKSDRDFIEYLEVEGSSVFDVSTDISAEFAKMAEDYDIVHTHDWFGAEAGFKAQKYSDVVWISTIHSLSSDRFRGVSKDIEKLEDIACRESDKVIAVSKDLEKSIDNNHSVEEAEVIHNGFSVPSSSGIDVRENLGVGNEDIVFFVGRHAEQKGIEYLIYGFAKYLEDYPDTVLILGGDGHLKDSFEDFVELLGIQDNVFFEGFIPDKLLGDYYQCADVFVSPSISEPFGLTITEALSMGTPVLSTKSGVDEVLPQSLVNRIEPDSDSIRDGLKEVLNSESVDIDDFDSRSWCDMGKETLEVYRDFI